MIPHRLWRLVVVTAIHSTMCLILYGQFVAIAQGETRCMKALRVHKEITPEMRRFIRASQLPYGDERTREMTQFIMSGVAKRFYEEFCPALIDCGGLPGYPQSGADALIDICQRRK